MSVDPQSPWSGHAFQSVPESEAARKPSRNWGFITCMVIGGTVVMGGILMLVCCGGSLYYFGRTEEYPVTQADRDVVIDAELIAEYDTFLSPRPDQETISKDKYFDGSYELSYEYDAIDDIDPVYISYVLSYELSEEDATSMYFTSWTATKFGMNIGADVELTFDERTVDLPVTKSRFAVVLSDGQELGNILIVQQGNIVITFLITGIYFDEYLIVELINPILQRLDGYRPD